MQLAVSLSVSEAKHVADQRIELRAALGGEDARDRERVGRLLQANAEKARKLCHLLPGNRELLNSMLPLRGVV